MHDNSPRSQLSGLSLSLACVVLYCLNAGCSHKVAKIEKNMGRQAQRKLKKGGALIAGIEGWALTRCMGTYTN